MATNFVDNLVKEFLIFRGFSLTLKQFDAELKNDKHHSFRADKIVDQLMVCVNTHDLDTLVQYVRFFFVFVSQGFLSYPPSIPDEPSKL